MFEKFVQQDFPLYRSFNRRLFIFWVRLAFSRKFLLELVSNPPVSVAKWLTVWLSNRSYPGNATEILNTSAPTKVKKSLIQLISKMTFQYFFISAKKINLLNYYELWRFLKLDLKPMSGRNEIRLEFLFLFWLLAALKFSFSFMARNVFKCLSDLPKGDKIVSLPPMNDCFCKSIVYARSWSCLKESTS